MKSKIFFIYLFLFFLFHLSCKNENYSYAIKDFDNSLKPYLVKIVSKGIVGYDSSTMYLKKNATDKELVKLSMSEHPVLRAIAVRIILQRPSFDHFKVMMNHLDDTAIVMTDAGEWGIWDRTVSDYMIENARWKNDEEKNKTIDQLITKHNYLRCAYTGLSKIKKNEAYYPFIKEMVMHDRRYEEIEKALYILASFQKKEDIAIIRQILLSNNWEMSLPSFSLMKDYPDSSYMDVLKKYYPRNYYGILHWEDKSSEQLAYIKTVASYKVAASAEILKMILNRKPFMPYPADTSYLKEKLIYTIWNNPCKAYIELRKQIEPYIQKYEYEHNIGRVDPLPIDTSDIFKDTSPEPIRW